MGNSSEECLAFIRVLISPRLLDEFIDTSVTSFGVQPAGGWLPARRESLLVSATGFPDDTMTQ